MAMNILTILVNHLMGGASASQSMSELFPSLSKPSLRKAAILLAAAATALILMFWGLFTVLLDLVLATQASQELRLSSAAGVGLGLILLSGLIFTTVLSRRTWRLKKEPPSTLATATGVSSPVQEAVAELIRDFVVERQLVRQAQITLMEQAAAAQTESSSQFELAQGPIHSAPWPSDKKGSLQGGGFETMGEETPRST